MKEATGHNSESQREEGLINLFLKNLLSRIVGVYCLYRTGC